MIFLSSYMYIEVSYRVWEHEEYIHESMKYVKIRAKRIIYTYKQSLIMTDIRLISITIEWILFDDCI